MGDKYEESYRFFFLKEDNQKYDKYQRKAIVNNSQYLLVVAAAGSGKTTTIVGKVKYLIEVMGYHEKDIMILSFTNETVNNLKNKITYNVDIFTFHKLALTLLQDYQHKYFIARPDLLEYIVNEFFLSYLSYPYRTLLLEYFSVNDINVILTSGKIDILKYDIISFIKKIKCNNFQVKYLRKVIKKISDNKQKIFLTLALKIYSIYEEELVSCNKIDFDDMIIYAQKIIKEKTLKRKYQYIIIDEYQDISLNRFNLIREIVNKTKAKLMCVGDDYQSIYGFSGSNLALFLNYKNFFPNYQRIDIKNTYRNSYELIKISQRFILKNPYQLRKSIYAKFLLKYPVVLVYYDELVKTYYQLLDYLYLEDKKDIMVLARYNKDLEKVRKDNNLKYLTVHRSKGLEADNVIILNMSDDYLGFPSNVKENDCFTIFDKFQEKYDYAEERRLFYVAITRAKEKVFILIPRKNPSIFIKEIKKYCVELIMPE